MEKQKTKTKQNLVVTKTLIVTHCHFGCIRPQNWVCLNVQLIADWAEKKKKKQEFVWRPTTPTVQWASTLAPFWALTSVSGVPPPLHPRLNVAILPQSPVTLSSSVLSTEILLSEFSWAARPSASAHWPPRSLESCLGNLEMAWDNSEVSVIFVNGTDGTESQIILFLPFIGEPSFLPD